MTPGCAEADATWRPTASPATIRLRARLRQRARAFFERRECLEVDTPYLSAAAPTEPEIESLRTRVLGQTTYLHTSPEFPMKRLLAAGLGDCWQLARVFRAGERGRWHQPEFDLVEWYRLGHDHHALMDEVEAFVQTVLGPEREVAPAQRLCYCSAFESAVGLDPLTASAAELGARARALGLPALESTERNVWLDYLLSAALLPALPMDRPTLIYDWPADQAALARINPGDPRLAARFELFWGELELANGFHELADAAEQRTRFEAEQQRRAQRGQQRPPLDERLLDALASGLPACAGVALGFDRLVMLAAGAERIDEVVAFPFERA